MKRLRLLTAVLGFACAAAAQTVETIPFRALLSGANEGRGGNAGHYGCSDCLAARRSRCAGPGSLGLGGFAGILQVPRCGDPDRDAHPPRRSRRERPRCAALRAGPNQHRRRCRNPPQGTNSVPVRRRIARHHQRNPRRSIEVLLQRPYDGRPGRSHARPASARRDGRPPGPDVARERKRYRRRDLRFRRGQCGRADYAQ